MKLIIFDCDGTIVDSQHVIVAAMEHAFVQAGLTPPPRADILGVVGLSLVPAVTKLLIGYGQPLETHEPMRPNGEGHDGRLAARMAEFYKQAFQHLRCDPANHEPLYPGARAAIETLAATDNVMLGIATGKSRRGVDVLFERENLGHHFSTIQTADDHPSKPHPSMILQALAETAGTSTQAVMIGDTTYDMEMACAAGVAPLGVAWGYHQTAALEAAGARVVIHDYGDLASAVDSLLSLESRAYGR
jgi:phosphoglycolate phosphatase